MRREVHPLPTVDETLAGAKIFSKLDANSGFWQIPLAPSSRLLTTFITPMGRYCFNKLPFGICSAPEVFQRRMNEQAYPELYVRLTTYWCLGAPKRNTTRTWRMSWNVFHVTLHVTLSKEKCEYYNHILRTCDPEAIAPPTNTSELRRFLGMVNQLGKFSWRSSHNHSYPSQGVGVGTHPRRQHST